MSASLINWLHPLVHPCRPSTRTQKNLDGLVTYLQNPLTPGEFPVLSDPCGRLHEVKLDDHDLADSETLPELAPALYFNTIRANDGVTVVPQRWVCGLAGSGLFYLLLMPHFGHYSVIDWLAR